VIEATGVPEVAQQTLQALDRGGTLLIFGVSPESGRIDVSPFRIYNEEHSIIGSMAVLNSFEPALRMLASGAIDPETMVTHRFSLEDFDGALEAMRARQGLKIQIAFD
jgi:NADPH2:quinone reductase